MKMDLIKVSQIIREIAQTEILPRYHKLAQDDIFEKSPGDFVTTADFEAEKKLTARLKDLIIGSLVIGEEAVNQTPELLDKLDKDDYIWIIDPVDGTGNFVKGNDKFGSIVSLIHHKEIIAGWIFDPINDQMYACEKGAGAYKENESLNIQQKRSFSDLVISLSHQHKTHLLSQHAKTMESFPKMVNRNGSVAHDYIALVSSTFNCIQYRRLNPWDHAAGILLHREAGGYDRLMFCEDIYHPKKYNNEGLVITPNQDVWQQTFQFFNPGKTF